ncbi:MAG: MBL fold metallo-hydrolase [Patescibacteria group bacterium]
MAAQKKEAVKSIQLTVFGARGSSPVAGRDYIEFGGNTTCVRVESPCLPPDMALSIDSGSGYRPFCGTLLGEGIMKIGLLQTHYHWDHIQGFPFGPHAFIPGCHTQVWGPKDLRDKSEGPEESFARQMAAPNFPYPFDKVRHQLQFKALEYNGTQVLVWHPKGGVQLVKLHQFVEMDVEDGQMRFNANAFGDKGTYALNECLVIKWYKAIHPDKTVSYRFEERSTGRKLVFLTDHEVSPAWSTELLAHLKGANLLLQDAQFKHADYLAKYVEWGHGTPEYAAQTAMKAGVGRLGLVHHDPAAKDSDIQQRVIEARSEFLRCRRGDLSETVFAAKDFQTIVV